MARSRKNHIDIMLNDTEYSKLQNDIFKAQINKSDYIRRLIFNKNLREKPDERFFDVLDQLIRIQTNLNQIADKAEFLNDEDKEVYRNKAREWSEFHLAIRKKYL